MRHMPETRFRNATARFAAESVAATAKHANFAVEAALRAAAPSPAR